ncbi:hypothetical protein QN277_018567 [Acacia crassicarpa]|uniref:Nucleolus and neural progenitor protein-like N-terminal domain-containing protein n=1 Tax=Acacia crassicarpa TaxID=499986 RepID=A0AAE1JRW7_9FABA|nr:hypothetical protein QN277_018567 [Acacia crassicarpa]
MDSEAETIERRFRSLFGQLQVEYGILERMVHKNKNQHRRCSYFKYLLKVGRDLRLLQSVHLEELVVSCLLVIKGDKPKQKAHLLENLKKRKCNSGRYNFLERILGAARLLAEMVEPMLKAATEVSILLAQSFFMRFSLTIMAILARLRVLVQQILLDMVTLFNMVSSISHKKQSIKIKQEGVEVFREYFPVSEDFVMLECVWKTDKFVLLEKKCKSENASKNEDSGGSIPVQASAINYESIESWLGETESDQHASETNKVDSSVKDEPSHVKGATSDLVNKKEVRSRDDEEGKENPSSNIEGFSFTELPPKDGLQLHASLNSTTKLDSSSSKKVAFVSIKRPKLSTEQALSPLAATVSENRETRNDNEGDTLVNLLSDGIPRNSVF